MAIEVRPTRIDHVVNMAVSWDAYIALVESLGDHSRERLTYDEGVLEIMSPGPTHERVSRLIAQLIFDVGAEWQLSITATGSTTFQHSGVRGFEADESFYIANSTNVRNFDTSNLSDDPPPDLAVEVDISNIREDKKATYARVGIPEFWRYRSEQLTAFALANGEYVEINVSRVLAGLPIVEIERRLRRTDNKLELIQQWRTWLRGKRDPKLDAI